MTLLVVTGISVFPPFKSLTYSLSDLSYGEFLFLQNGEPKFYYSIFSEDPLEEDVITFLTKGLLEEGYKNISASHNNVTFRIKEELKSLVCSRLYYKGFHGYYVFHPFIQL